MINEKIFRAYDIRGAYPEEINGEAVDLIIAALAKFYMKNAPRGGRKTVVLGRDGRISSPELYRQALKTLQKFPQLKIIAAGLMTTPMLYFLTSYFAADGGIMITASHNPLRYNGIKMVKKRSEPINGLEVLRLLSK